MIPKQEACMTPKEKAIELVQKFEPYCYHQRTECALIAVNEVIEQRPHVMYWYKVKEEIQKL